MEHKEREGMTNFYTYRKFHTCFPNPKTLL